jgi:acid phosphatase type 7
MVVGMRTRTAAIGAILGVAAAVPATAVPPDVMAGANVGISVARVQTEVIVVAAGDIACAARPFGAGSPDRCQYDETAELIARRGIEEVLPLGDLQYDEGEYRNFLLYYDRWWGMSKDNQSPVPGNHDHANAPNHRPRGYFRYFGNRVRGPNGWGYYSFDLPPGCTPGVGVCWHLIALNSEICYATGGCDRPVNPTDPGVGERMWRWLRRDLAVHPDSDYTCTLAYFHHPLFSFSSGSGASPAVRPLWRLLYDAEADVVLNGHSHNYQRWRPLTPGGEPSARGIREFVVGTGGASRYALLSGDPPANLVKAQDRSFGVLRLILSDGGYRWSWRTADGQPRFRDNSASAVDCA